jgi:hypothetical protein
MHQVDVALVRHFRLAGFLHQFQQALDAHGETDGRRRLAAERSDQRIVTAAGARCPARPVSVTHSNTVRL